LKRPVTTEFPEFAMDAHSRRPLHRQVSDFLRRGIAAGDLPAGSVLPSTRRLARRWRISRNTVLNAYEELAAEGLIAGRTGSGTRVRGAPAIRRMPDPRLILRASHYPARVAPFRDPEGNPLYVNSP